jgi:hypothetical protein
MGKRYPREFKKEVRKLVRLGLTKRDVSRMKKVSYNTLYTWTKDMKKPIGRFGIRGRSLDLLKILIERGYIIPEDQKRLATCARTLKKYLPLRRVKTKKAVVWFLAGRERDAMEGLLKSMGKRSIGYHELGYLRRAFGIKNIKRDNKIREVI